MANKKKGNIIPIIVLAGLSIAGIAWFFYTVNSAAPPLPATPMPVVFNTQYDGSVWQVTDWLEKHYPDNASLKVLHWGKVTRLNGAYMVQVKFSAKNKDGAVVLSDKLFALDKDGTIMAVTNAPNGTHR